LLKPKIKRELYRLFRDGKPSDSPAESRTVQEAADQNKAMENAGLTSRWIKWDMNA